jgi:tRNA threonylcarbamoyladenosine biosynthesis protein TsaE
MDTIYTQEELSDIATKVLASAAMGHVRGALVIGFEGPLGAGKTTLVQKIVKHYGNSESVTSPTFVIAKWYVLPQEVQQRFSTIVHIDAYRIEDEQELEAIHFDSLCNDEHTLVLVEWPSHIKEAMARARAVYFTLTHNKEHRSIKGPFRYEKK